MEHGTKQRIVRTFSSNLDVTTCIVKYTKPHERGNSNFKLKKQLLLNLKKKNNLLAKKDTKNGYSRFTTNSCRALAEYVRVENCLSRSVINVSQYLVHKPISKLFMR